MNSAPLSHLAVLTVTNPAEAARRLLSLRPGREVLWLAFFLAVVLNGLVQVGIDQLIVVPQGQGVVEAEPVLLNLLRSAGAMLLSIAAFLFIGKFMGGTASFEDIMILSVWLQFLQIVALTVTLLVSLVVPFFMVMLMLATAILSLYVTLHFLNEAHKFGSLLKSFGVIVLSALVALPFVLVLTPSGPV
ncbi:Yip1 domain protein [Ruegeria sp. THAF57]|uniref:Yip1 family protein n=1 Tax=Ruegeria sp. THAF57 TaxID=2744555 RepID=UPI0015DDD075|nr:Yip1 family protein [Ruegeria sp. THAF57]CAD0185617.1 Yip1 domain protein [Ruegeria sp. THAF57]